MFQIITLFIITVDNRIAYSIKMIFGVTVRARSRLKLNWRSDYCSFLFLTAIDISTLVIIEIDLKMHLRKYIYSYRIDEARSSRYTGTIILTSIVHKDFWQFKIKIDRTWYTIGRWQALYDTFYDTYRS
jgi:hypothetical protein